MSLSPFQTYPGLMERNHHLVHLCLRNSPNVVGYQFWGAPTPNDAYGNPLNSGVLGVGSTAMFAVAQSGGFRSPTLRRKGLGQIVGSTRGQTHMVFDSDDYPAVLPQDDSWMFLRVQEDHLGAGLLSLAGNPADPCLGPIYCLPPAPYFGMRRPAFTLQATAPSSTGSSLGALPVLDEDLTSAGPRAMCLVFPRQLTELTVRNLSGVSMLVSFGLGQGMRDVAAGGVVVLASGTATTKEIVVACPVGVAGAAFSLHAVSAAEM